MFNSSKMDFVITEVPLEWFSLGDSGSPSLLACDVLHPHALAIHVYVNDC